jgi:hypothetical protein
MCSLLLMATLAAAQPTALITRTSVPDYDAISAPSCAASLCWVDHQEWGQIITAQNQTSGPAAGQTVNLTIIYKVTKAYSPLPDRRCPGLPTQRCCLQQTVFPDPARLQKSVSGAMPLVPLVSYLCVAGLALHWHLARYADGGWLI